MSQAVETIAFELRAVGRMYGASALGYSLHVQVATLSRVGTFIGLPILGYAVDAKQGPAPILCSAIVAYSTFSTLVLISLFSHGYVQKASEWFFQRSSMGKGLAYEDLPIANSVSSGKDEEMPPCARSITATGACSFVFITCGIYVTLVLSSLFTESRAMILQLTPAITAAGTMFSVVFFDPRVSLAIDRSRQPGRVVATIYLSRVIGSVTLLVVCVIILFILELLNRG